MSSNSIRNDLKQLRVTLGNAGNLAAHINQHATEYTDYYQWFPIETSGLSWGFGTWADSKNTSAEAIDSSIPTKMQTAITALTTAIAAVESINQYNAQ